MLQDKHILRDFISNIELFSFPITASSILQFKNVDRIVMIRIYRKDHLLLDEREITCNGDYPVFEKIKQKGQYIIELLDNIRFYEKKIRFKVI